MSRFAVLLLLAASAGTLAAQPLETIAASYRKTPNPRTRAALLRFAQAHPSDRNGALALLALGSTEIEQRQFGDALQHLKQAEKRLPQLADYTAYLAAQAQSELHEFPAIERTLSPVWQTSPPSPLRARSADLQADSYLQTNRPKEALALVEAHLADLAGPQSELLLARASENDGNGVAAAAHFRKIYVEFPLSKEAADAETGLARYPPLDPKNLFTRGLNLVEGGDYARARKELTALLPRLDGSDLDLARVRIGAARYSARETRPAYDYLASFSASAPEVEAERLYYLLECARRLDRVDEMTGILDRISQSYPKSAWRLKALIAVAGYFSSHRQPEAAEPVYRACHQSFPDSPQSAQCHWRIAWAEYLRDPAGASSMIEEHLKRYPDSDYSTTALYFLGRVAEANGDPGAARACYEALNTAYPNYYYAMLARDRLGQPGVASAARSAQATQLLNASQLSKRRHAENFVPSPATKLRVERAHLLASASLDAFAEDELRYGARVDGQPHLMALELADLATRRDAPDLGIRYIKRFAPAYMSLAIEAAPEKFWRLAFPLPYWRSLEQYARERSLDPFLVAALIRQESEFNTKAVSRSNARGLTQVMPATGRELSRRLKIPRYSTALLFSPDINLKIGTFYLKALSDQLQGQWEATLASYNAGKSRAVAWLASAKFREPAEFVESIPFSETRAYVQSVLRNAEVYRKLYGPKASPPVTR